jgi:putative transposase
MCRVLGVQRSEYYAWRRRKPSARAQANEVLVNQIRAEHATSRRTYGSPRIMVGLQRKGVVCGKNRVARLMRLHGIVAQQRHKWHPTVTQRQPGVIPAPNRLNQDFTAADPNRKWVSDFTYVDTAEGWRYLATVVDLFSRKVVGWAMSEQMDTALVETAWQMARRGRQPAPGLLHHSDQGSQYTSLAYDWHPVGLLAFADVLLS